MRLLIIIIFLFGKILSQNVGVTVDGKFVLLRSDSTWEYITQEQAAEYFKLFDLEKATSPNEPSVSDFEIISATSTWEGGRFRIIGEIRNNGDIAAGVQIEAIARDKDGRLVDSVKFWPNSIENILPGRTTGLGYTVTRNPRAKTIEVQIISVTVW